MYIKIYFPSAYSLKLTSCPYGLKNYWNLSYFIPDTEKDWRWEEKGQTEDEVVGWHHWLDGCESEQAPGVGDGQGNLACCSPWGLKELDTTKRLNWLSWALALEFLVLINNTIYYLYIYYTYLCYMLTHI